MKTIEQFILSRFKTLSILMTSMLFSIILLMVRIKLTHSFFYLFLVWNLFLACIPYAITVYLLNLPKLNKFHLLFWFGVWLLFLPNAPYLITDLLHLKVSKTPLLWLDILVIVSFAGSGLLFFFLSLFDMKRLLQKFLNSKKANYLCILICFLSGFGIYLGRFLRYNSWEVLSNPQFLFKDIFLIVTQPFSHNEAWLFTLLFGLFLNLGFWVFDHIRKVEH